MGLKLRPISVNTALRLSISCLARFGGGALGSCPCAAEHSSDPRSRVQLTRGARAAGTALRLMMFFASILSGRVCWKGDSSAGRSSAVCGGHHDPLQLSCRAPERHRHVVSRNCECGMGLQCAHRSRRCLLRITGSSVRRRAAIGCAPRTAHVFSTVSVARCGRFPAAPPSAPGCAP